MLIKLSRSGLQDAAALERLLSVARRNAGAGFLAPIRSKGKFATTGGGSAAAAFVRGTGASARAREGELVGEGAEKIGTDNIGHRLLSMMG